MRQTYLVFNSLLFKPGCLVLLLSLLLNCQPNNQSQQIESDTDTRSLVPEWSRKAIWYQIFVERFRNGDPSNDPRPQDLIGGDPTEIPSYWSVTSWGHDWYVREPWLEESTGVNFYHKIQQRRYGGDLQGVLDQMDYIQSLGVNAIYFNPLNDAPSLHKYDARNYRHIDRNFGPDPDGDAAIMASEVPDDPTTWQWTAADRLFLDIIAAFHERGIKVILDYSWNHTGTEFWAIKDLRENGSKSKYIDWFNIISFDNPDTEVNEFDYEGWAGFKGMPVVKKDIVPEDDDKMPFEGNLTSPTLKQHIYYVSRRWLDPNGDGDPTDGVDGYRLDVAGEVPMGFWRDYRKEVRKVNPDAYLVGEIWWLEWPETFLGPQPYIGDQFDAIMNYRWYRLARGFFAQAEPVLNASSFVKGIAQINKDIAPQYLQAMMNMSASHDTPRLSTSFYNKTMHKYQAKPNDNPDYKIEKPDALTLQEQKLFLIHQFTFVGSPQIWNGDELGMWGADDPDCRKPLIWDDIAYETERAHYHPDRQRQANEVVQDKALFDFYRQLIQMRRDNEVLSLGELNFVHASDEQMTLAYERTFRDEIIIAAFNRSNQQQSIVLDPVSETVQPIFGEGDFDQNSDGLTMVLGPLSALVLRL